MDTWRGAYPYRDPMRHPRKDQSGQGQGINHVRTGEHRQNHAQRHIHRKRSMQTHPPTLIKGAAHADEEEDEEREQHEHQTDYFRKHRYSWILLDTHTAFTAALAVIRTYLLYSINGPVSFAMRRDRASIR